jgi:hypothetical protein
MPLLYSKLWVYPTKHGKYIASKTCGGKHVLCTNRRQKMTIIQNKECTSHLRNKPLRKVKKNKSTI